MVSGEQGNADVITARHLYALFALIILAIIVWYANYVLLLLFASVLLAILLRTLAHWLSRPTRLPIGASLAVVVLALIGTIAGAILFMAPQLAARAEDFFAATVESLERARRFLEQYEFGRQILQQDVGEVLPADAQLVGRIMTGVAGAVGGVTGAVIVAILGIFIAAEPSLYRRGALRIVPRAYRARAEVILDDVTQTLQWWLLGQTISMVFLGTQTWIGLWLLGVPQAFMLALLAAALAFIPYLGPIISTVPAVMIGLTVSPQMALYVLLLYIVIQNAEGLVLLPLVYKGTVHLAPALTVVAQVVAGTLAGALGVVLATPITAAAVVLVQRLYVEDTLGDSFEKPVTQNEAR